MKAFVAPIGLAMFCLAASAQPISFGGITPGKTSQEEFKALAKGPVYGDGSAELRQPEGSSVQASFDDGVVYELAVTLSRTPGLQDALVEKYGSPKIKVGKIRTVTCQNGYGASFTRFEGEEEYRWPVKDGVQAAIKRFAFTCGESVVERYVLRHVETVRKIEAKAMEKIRSNAEQDRAKLKDSL